MQVSVLAKLPALSTVAYLSASLTTSWPLSARYSGLSSRNLGPIATVAVSKDFFLSSQPHLLDLTALIHKVLVQKSQEDKMENMGLGRIGKFLGGMEGLVKFLEGMEAHGRIVDVFLNASITVAFVWGPIKFLLQVSLKHDLSAMQREHHGSLTR